MDQNLVVIGEKWTRILLSKVEYGQESYCHRRKIDGGVAKAQAIVQTAQSHQSNRCSYTQRRDTSHAKK